MNEDRINKIDNRFEDVGDYKNHKIIYDTFFKKYYICKFYADTIEEVKMKFDNITNK